MQNQNWYGPDALPAITTNITIIGNGDTLQISGTSMRFLLCVWRSGVNRRGAALWHAGT